MNKSESKSCLVSFLFCIKAFAVFFKEVDVLRSLVIYLLTKNNHYMFFMAFYFGFLSQLIFTVKSVEQDVLCITVFDRDLFSPNGKC